jgi:pimeloyl-ACP methyl ester carboxylesterase
MPIAIVVIDRGGDPMSEQPNIRRPHDGSIDIDFCPQAALAERRLIVSERPGGAMNAVYPQPARTRPELVIALHCSGSNAAQWRSLEAQLGQSFRFAAPEHYDSGNSPSWTGGHPFTLADEAERTLALIDAAGGGVHLVGHSYGGGVALHVAAARADRIASLALYEPSAFYLLKQFGDGAGPFAEIKAVADMVSTGIRSGDRRNAAKVFVDYWGGAGAWEAIRLPLRDALIRWLPKVSLEFDALFNEPTPWGTLTKLHLPTLIIRGECTPAPTRLIADTLASILPNARRVVVTGAGHMGPLTHGTEVNTLVIEHIKQASSRAKRQAA